MTDFTSQEISAYYQQRVPDLKQPKGVKVWRGRCPVHDGEGDNFAVDSETGMAHCHSQCQKGWDVLGLEMELSSRDFPTSKREVFKLIGRKEPSYVDRDILASFDYTDADGQLLYQVVRKYPKRFGQRRMDASGKWIWSLGDTVRVPFQLPQLIKESVVCICEGEKDALSLTRRGIFSTCNSEGAGKWRTELTRWFKGKKVYILPDNDAPGREHALKVAQALSGTAEVVRIAEIPDLPAKGDVSDFFAAGRSIEELKKILGDSQTYTKDFQFVGSLVSEEDKWVRNTAEVVKFHGGMSEFWNMADEDGIATPFAQLTEELSGGLRNGEVYILAGPRGEGKTSLLLQFISQASNAGYGGLLFSLEMGDKDVTRRLVAMEERVNIAQVRILQLQKKNGDISVKDQDLLDGLMHKLKRGTKRVEAYPLLVHQKPAVSPHYLIDETKRLASRQRIHYLAIDHAQLMSSTGNEQKDYEKFTAISRSLKGEVARELQIPVLIVSQISRNAAIEKRGELEITDLRGSGAWEEDAAAVFLLYHNAEHVQQLKASGELGRGPVKTHLKLGKNRFGSSGTYLDLQHFKVYTRFESFDDRDYIPDIPIQQTFGGSR